MRLINRNEAVSVEKYEEMSNKYAFIVWSKILFSGVVFNRQIEKQKHDCLCILILSF